MVLIIHFGTGKSTSLDDSGRSGAAGSQERVENESVWGRKCLYETLDETDRKLARMLCLFYATCLDIGDVPDVTRVFPQGITAELAALRAFVVPLSGIPLG